MRFIISFIVTLLSQLAVFCQQEPVLWDLSAKKISNQQYVICLKGSVQPGWYVYAVNNKELGIDGIRLLWENHSNSGNELQRVKGSIKQISDAIFENKLVNVFYNSFELNDTIIVEGVVPEFMQVTIHVFAANGLEFLPIELTRTVKLGEGASNSINTLRLGGVDLENPVASCGDLVVRTGSSSWSIFLKGFVGGLLALLMPCIFPLLSVTVSFFMNRAESKQKAVRNGLLYGGFIFLIYLLASIPFHLIGNVNPQIFNIISTDKWVNLVFFAVFLVFALSLFGLFELKLPGATAVDRKSNSGSIAGIFFMALTLVIVSFSCTGPILGFLLVNSVSSNGAWALTAGLAGFGLALALPFGLFAMFPQWMKRLPKSGGWMETLKKSLAFVELALALKFLSNADLVEHWGILKREVFIGVWILITLGLAIYLASPFFSFLRKAKKFEGLRVAQENSIKVRPKFKWRIGFALLVLLFTLYLVPGLTQSKYANLKLVSGFPPPLSYSVYGKDNVHGKGLEPDVINEYEKALQLAKEQQKPLLIDFTGWACVNCRKMEENVWTRTEIRDLIDSNFILVSLYVDDRAKLPADKQFSHKDSTGEERFIRTVGDKWAAFQSSNFGSASQPQYVILSPDEKLMNHPVGYSSASDYKEWLQCGINAFEARNKIVKR